MLAAQTDDSQITGIIAVILVTILNLISRSAGSQSSLVITVVKTLSLVFVGVLGMVHLIRAGPGPALQADNFFRGTSTAPSAYAIALYSGLWAFDGWDACCVSLQAHISNTSSLSGKDVLI